MAERVVQQAVDEDGGPALERRIAELTVALTANESRLREEVAARRAAERKLATYESEYAAFAEAARLATFTWEPGKRGVYTPYLERLHGFAPGTYDGAYESWLARIHEDDRAYVNACAQRAIEDGQFEFEYRVVLPNEGIRWLQSRGRVFRQEPNGVPRFVGAVFDITALKEAEAALGRSEERFAKIFAASPDAMAVMRREDGTILDVNDRWVATFGYAWHEALGQTARSLGIYANIGDADAIWSMIAEGGRVRSREIDLRNKAGEVKHFLLSVDSAIVNGEPCVIGTARDVTLQRQTEWQLQAQREQLAHLGRVVTLGELAGTLAHELEQPLTAIFINTEAAQRLLKQCPVDMDAMAEIVKDIAADDRRAHSVLARIRAMMRRQPAQFAEIDLEEVVMETLAIAKYDLARRGVTVRLSLAALLPPVQADRTHVQQVLLNLLINAADAMSTSDVLSRVITVESKLTQSARPAACLSISDQGTGIAPDHFARLFEPFVTTKPHGLGLGLAICRNIVMAHGGRLWATNNPGRGATFHVELPLAR